MARSAAEPALAALLLVVAVHGPAPRARADGVDELEEEQDEREHGAHPRERVQDGEEPARVVLPAPREAGPVRRRGRGAGDVEDGKREEADERVQEGVEDRVLVAVVDRAQAEKRNNKGLFAMNSLDTNMYGIQRRVNTEVTSSSATTGSACADQ
jgi:hypothetical protein